MTSTEDLIASLADKAQPVKRLRAPWLRAFFWLAGCLALLGLATLVTNAWPAMMTRLTDGRFALEMVATTLTGIAAVVAAFFVGLPDRSRLWLALPLPFLALWIGSSGYECYRNWVEFGPGQSLIVGESLHCFGFIVGLSIPLAGALYFAVGRIPTLYPGQVMAVGGLGIAALGAAMLQFFHPFDVTAMDLGLHAAAVALVAAVMGLFGRGRMRIQPKILLR